MSHKHEHSLEEKACHEALHIGVEITKLVLRGIAVTAAICIAKNLYKIHRSIEAYKK